MLDIGLSELGLIAIVALVVVGPKRLPMVARTAGTLLGRAQRYIREVKDEVSHQVALEELKSAAQSVQTEVHSAQQALNKEFDQMHSEVVQLSPQGTTVAQALAGDAPTKAESQVRARRFRRRSQQQARTPLWFKQQQGIRRQVQSAAARLVRYRDKSVARRKSSFF